MTIGFGKKLGRYEIRESLGTGGMGEVYMATDTRLGRKVAVKILTKQMAMDPVFRSRFKKEAKAVAALSHPNILSIHDFGEEDGLPYAVMELLEGRNLRETMAEPLGWRRVAELGIEIAKGLAAAHEKGIIHRDLKPENVFITAGGQVKILDFGLARTIEPSQVISTDTATLRTLPGEVVGTSGYMSPEQAQGLTLNPQTDLFPLGCILYEALTGQKPFHEKTPIQTMLAIIGKNPPPIKDFVDDVPAELIKLTMRCLEKKPEDRMPSARVLVMELKSLLRDSEIKTMVYPQTHSVVWKWPKVLLSTLAVIAAFGYVYLVNKTGRFLPFIDPAPPNTANEKTVIPERRVISLAVLYFVNHTGEPELDWLEKGIPDMLINQFSYSDILHVTSTEKMREVLDSLGKRKGPLDRESALDIARRTKADYLVTGNVLKSGTAFRILSTIYDLKLDKLIKTEMVEGEGQPQLFDMIDELSRKIKIALEIEASGNPRSLEDFVKVKTNSVEAYRYYVQGLEFLQEYHDREAITLLRKAIQLDPEFAHAHLYLAKAYDILGERELARETMTSAIKHSGALPSIDRLSFRLAEAELNDDWSAALGYLKRLTVIQPEEAQWHFKLGFHYEIHNNEIERGLREYQTALTIEPDGMPLIYRYYGTALLKSGQVPKALDVFGSLVALLPETPISHDSLGYGYLWAGEYRLAFRAFDKALALKEDYIFTLGHMGHYYMLRGQFIEAERYFDRYLTLALGRYEEREGLAYLARSYYQRGDYQASLAVVQQALALDDGYLIAYWLKGLNHLELNEVGLAQASVDRMAAIIESSGSKLNESYFLHLRGKILAVQGRFDRAIDQFLTVLEKGTLERYLVSMDLAQTYLANGYLDLAVETCQGILNTNPQYARAHFTLGKIYEEKDQKGKARHHFQKFLRIWEQADPDLAMVQEAKARL